MGRLYEQLSSEHIAFIARQQIFFVGTATAQSRINISPKGLDTLHVMGPERVIWLNLTGSGNESGAHVVQHPRMTLMFCAFEGEPLILRLYGMARVIHPGDPDWEGLVRHFAPLPGGRQIFDVRLELVQTSCGSGVPLYDYAGQREHLTEWARKKGEEGVRRYWQERNRWSIDGLPTDLTEEDTP